MPCHANIWPTIPGFLNREPLQHGRPHDCVAQSTWHSPSAHCICNRCESPNSGAPAILHSHICTFWVAEPLTYWGSQQQAKPTLVYVCTCLFAHPQFRHRRLAPATLCQAALANAAPAWPFFFCTLGSRPETPRQRAQQCVGYTHAHALQYCKVHLSLFTISGLTSDTGMLGLVV